VGFWSSGIDDLGTFLASHPVPVPRLKILNWGFQKNLYVITGGAVYGRELFWNATLDRSSGGMTWDAEIRDGGVFLLSPLPAGSPALDDGARGFSAALARHRGQKRELVFSDRSGAPVARLIEILPAP